MAWRVSTWLHGFRFAEILPHVRQHFKHLSLAGVPPGHDQLMRGVPLGDHQAAPLIPGVGRAALWRTYRQHFTPGLKQPQQTRL